MDKLVKRAAWQARQPKYVNEARMTAQSTCHWNGPKITVRGSIVWDHSLCPVLIRGIQNYHMDVKGWSDIAYNFVECPHGYTFEGRGLDVINGANGTNSGNRSSHAIMCLAGEGNPFPDSEKLGFRNCVMYVANSTGALEGAKGHRDHKSTVCPGDERYGWVHQGMPVDEPVTTGPAAPTEAKEEDTMNEPLEIVKGEGPAWFVTDGVTRQWINREHAGILCINRGASAEVKPANMEPKELAKMKAWTWPQNAIDSIRLVGTAPPAV